MGLAAFALLAVQACSADEGRDSEGPSSRKAQAEGLPAEAQPASATPARPRRRERPLPAHQGWSLDGKRLDFADFIGRRLLLFLFNPEVDEAGAVAPAVAAVATASNDENFAVLGVSHGSTPDATKAFLAKHDLHVPVLDDPSGRVVTLLGLQARVALVLVDAEGYLVRGSTRFPAGNADTTGLVESELRGWLRLPDASQVAVPELGERPLAPHFTAPRLDGGEPFDLAETRGRPLALIFFLHTCPHCHSALRALETALTAIPEAQRPVLVGVSIVDRAAAVRQSLKDEDLDFFPVVFDPGGEISRAYGAQASVPVVFLIDTEGRIVSRTEGWRDERDPPLLRMRLARLAGVGAPLLLHKSGFSGNEFCTACHESQHATWLLTKHATAFDTLVRHGAERNGECVGCHVVGFGKSGGYELDQTTPQLENVGCEACHGRGGPHLSPTYVEGQDYEAVLSAEEKRALLARQGRPGELLPTSAPFVGSAACRDCHGAEYETWSAQPHARALASLAAKGESANAECLGCHTTGYEAEGGFPAGGSADLHPGLVGVGCESCHGPGGDHVADGARRIGTIVSLGDKCDSCVILKICGGCHDDANDPGFEFEVQEKIDLQRHGSIEPGTGKPKASRGAAVDPHARSSEPSFHGLPALSQALPSVGSGGS
jgi:peroxiredoxin